MRYLAILLLIFCTLGAEAQLDTLLLRNRDKIACKVQRIEPKQIVYVNPSLSEEVIFKIPTWKVVSITFKNGNAWENDAAILVKPDTTGYATLYPPRKFALKFIPGNFGQFGEFGVEYAVGTKQSVDLMYAYQYNYGWGRDRYFKLVSIGYKWRGRNKYNRQFMASGPFLKPSIFYHDYYEHLGEQEEKLANSAGLILHGGYQWIVKGRGFIEVSAGYGLAYLLNSAHNKRDPNNPGGDFITLDEEGEDEERSGWGNNRYRNNTYRFFQHKKGIPNIADLANVSFKIGAIF
ncbi:DUF3575 domain-containing protein [Luteibaculum oceani]|uniref:DUF3575 domain-containing protein n=1 Tax=Luteibaculum oceani TaxID=1294296 RepID=A0A5C6UU12_9FLAO|nr:DUF3575 domain-containing protein [Luteibaculum oceani]TXC76124.1 DUF3575 domain-containing protein [Luteibaculum oceani]